MEANLKLRIAMIPKNCWGKNVRTVYSQKEWKQIACTVRKQEKYRCHICSKWSLWLEAHEVWYFDEIKHIQKLVMIMGVCKNCHNVIHYGGSQYFKNEKKLAAHFMKINLCDREVLNKSLFEAYEKCARLNQIADWQLDLSALLRDGYLTGEIHREKQGVYKGFAFLEASKNPKVFYGNSHEDILTKLKEWNSTKVQKEKFVTCNIGVRSGFTEYTNWHNYDVDSGKDITRIYLHLPHLEKEDFKRITEELSANGAKFSGSKKLWYIRGKDVDLNVFLKYLPIEHINGWEGYEYKGSQALPKHKTQ